VLLLDGVTSDEVVWESSISSEFILFLLYILYTVVCVLDQFMR
jgi:hypothetical protein